MALTLSGVGFNMQATLRGLAVIIYIAERVLRRFRQSVFLFGGQTRNKRRNCDLHPKNNNMVTQER